MAPMRVELKPHPQTPSGAIVSIEAEAWRTQNGDLLTRHRAIGEIGALRLPPCVPARRADNLWKHTCFEAFVGDGGGGYYEFNYSPSSEWGAYHFDGYRSGMAAAAAIRPELEISYGEGVFELRAFIAGDQLALLDRPWRLALAAVIEEMNGVKSYWALAHAPGKPDFHHRDGFALELP